MMDSTRKHEEIAHDRSDDDDDDEDDDDGSEQQLIALTAHISSSPPVFHASSSSSLISMQPKTTTTSSTRKRRREYSDIWHYIRRTDDENLVLCNRCQQKYKICHGTSSIRRHLKICVPEYGQKYQDDGNNHNHNNPSNNNKPPPMLVQGQASSYDYHHSNNINGTMKNNETPQKMTTTLSATTVRTTNNNNSNNNNHAIENSNYSSEKAVEKLIQLLFTAHLPFHFVEQPIFQAFVSALQPNFVVPLKDNLIDHVNSLYAQLLPSLIEYLADDAHGRFSLNAEVWCDSYLVLWVHFLNGKWQRVKLIVGLQPLTNLYDHEEISEKICQEMEKWPSVMRKVMTTRLSIVHRNSLYVSDSMLSHVAAFQESSVQRRIMHDGQIWLPVPHGCLSQVARLIANRLIEVGEAQNVMTKLRSHVGADGGVDVMEDDPLKRSLYLIATSRTKRSVSSSVKGNGTQVLTRGDWAIVDLLERLLVPLNQLTDVIPSHLAFWKVYSLQTILLQEQEKVGDIASGAFTQAISKCVEILNTCWTRDMFGSSTLGYRIAHVLDPRSKLVYYKYKFPNRVDDLKRTVYDIYEKYYTPGCTSTLSSIPIPSEALHSVSDFPEDFQEILCHNLPIEKSPHSLSHSSELEDYLSRDLHIHAKDKFNIEGWWKDHEVEYPHLARMARDFLALTSCSSNSICVEDKENNFVVSKLMSRIEEVHNKLPVDMVRTILLTENWLTTLSRL